MYSCTMPVPDQGDAGGTCPPPTPHEEDVSVLKKNRALYVRNGLVEFGYRCFGVVWCVSMDRTTAMQTDKIRKRVLPRVVG